MGRYDEFVRKRSVDGWPGRARGRGRRRRYRRPAPYAYGTEYEGYRTRGGYGAHYEEIGFPELRRAERYAARRPARGYPVRGIHTYDLDYGRQAGGPDTDYSGRAGYETYERAPEPVPRGPYTPYLADRLRRPPAYEERHWSAVESAPGARRPRHRRRGP